MKKLTTEEHNALAWLNRQGSYCPGRPETEAERQVVFYLDSLCRKRRAIAEETDDGPRYSLAPAGHAELGNG
jgi:hypothetical protein